MEFADTVKNKMQHLNSEGGIKVEQENPLTVGENVRMVEEEDNDNDNDKKIEFDEEDDIDGKMVEVDDNDNEGDKEEEEEQEEDDNNNDNDNEGDEEEDDDDGDYNEGDAEEVQEEDNANDTNDEGDEEENDDDDDDDEVVQEAWAAFIQIKVRVALLWITADILNGWLWEVELMEKGKLFNIYTTYPSHSS